MGTCVAFLSRALAPPTLAVSAEEMVLALGRAGFVARRDETTTVLQQRYRVVVIPHVPLLSEDQLATVLRSAGLSFTELLEHIDGEPDGALRDVAR